MEVRDQPGWIDARLREALAPRRSGRIVNARGVEVGGCRAVFRLQSASHT